MLMLGRRVGLRRRLLRPYLFLVACFATEPVVIGALALRLGLGLATPQKLEASLRWPALPW